MEKLLKFGATTSASTFSDLSIRSSFHNGNDLQT